MEKYLISNENHFNTTDFLIYAIMKKQLLIHRCHSYVQSTGDGFGLFLFMMANKSVQGIWSLGRKGTLHGRGIFLREPYLYLHKETTKNSERLGQQA